MLSSTFAYLALVTLAVASPVSVVERSGPKLFAERLHPSSPSLAFKYPVGYDDNYSFSIAPRTSVPTVIEGSKYYQFTVTDGDCFAVTKNTGTAPIELAECEYSTSPSDPLLLRAKFHANDKGDYVVLSSRGNGTAEYPARPYLAIKDDIVYVTDQKNASDASQIRLVYYK